MELTHSPAMQVLYSHHQVTMADLGKLAGVVLKELQAEATHNGWMISGPVIWIYRGADGQPDTVFDLEIALPVQGNGKTTQFSVKKLLPFKSVSYSHEGEWEKMSAGYGLLMQHIGLNQLGMTRESRETYFNIDFLTPVNNRTLIQVGIL